MQRICAPELQATLRAAIAAALAALTGAPHRGRSVHDARKSIKRVRAALRLLREPLGETRYRRSNIALRDAGRCLAPLRDATVQASVFDALLPALRAQLPELHLSALQRDLHAQRAAAQRRFRPGSAPMRRAGALLRGQLRSIERLRMTAVDPPDALRRMYARARKAWRALRDPPAPAALHEWRKQVKYLLLGMDMLEDALSGKATAARKHLSGLADTLGDEHDLVMLMDAVAARAPQLHGKGTVGALETLIALRRRHLHKQALGLGEQLFEEKPRKFARRLN